MSYKWVNSECHLLKPKTNESYLPLKSRVNTMQTKYEICISRKQVLLQHIKYIHEFTHSYSLQNKYFCIKNLFGDLFSVA